MDSTPAPSGQVEPDAGDVLVDFNGERIPIRDVLKKTTYPPRRDPLPIPPQPSLQPHRCPVCDGRGSVPAGFYSPANTTGSANPEPCRSCGGQGVLWR